MQPQTTKHRSASFLRAILSCDRATVVRSTVVAGLVGPALTAVNQAESVFGAGPIDIGKASLTLLIPFLVSCVSSVLASRQAAHEASALKGELARDVVPVVATIDQIRMNAANVNSTARARYEETKALLLRAQKTVHDIEGSASLVQEALTGTASVQEQFQAVLAAEEQVQEEIRNSAKGTTAVSSAIVVARGRFSEISALAHDIARIGHQTTLLSLNAAVVAATAGTEGRRFAAIADSIRELARETELQAKRIAATTRDLEQSAAEMATESDRLRVGTQRLLERSDASRFALSRAADSMTRSIHPTQASLDMLARQTVQIRAIADGIGSVVDHAEASIAGSARNVELARGVMDELGQIAASPRIALSTDRS